MKELSHQNLRVLSFYQSWEVSEVRTQSHHLIDEKEMQQLTQHCTSE